MKIRQPLYVLIMSVVVIGILGVNILMITMLANNKQFLIYVVPFIITIFAVVIFNCVYLIRVYKDYITLTDNSIIINYGFRKKDLSLSNIISAHYNKNSIICYMADGSQNRIDITFVSKGDEIALYKFLKLKSINVIT